MENPAVSLKRVPFIDEMRGFLIIYVVIYHLLYDLAVIFPVGIEGWFFCDFMTNMRYCFTGSLIVISGISCHFSRSNVKRGCKTLALAMLLTIVTMIFIPDQIIIFGVLHFFGAAMLIYGVGEKLWVRIPSVAGLIVSALLFFLTWDIYNGSIGLFGLFSVPLPASLYNIPVLFPLGFSCPGVYSADYYPILPWIFLFFIGSYLGRYIAAGRGPKAIYVSRAPELAFIGRHTLLIYMLHQAVIYGILWVIFSLIRR